MAKSKKQDTIIGNGFTEIPILAKESAPTEVRSRRSRPRIKVGEGSTNPGSIQECLSLLQTICFDLRSLEFELAILARNNRLYIVMNPPASIENLGVENGHITIDGKPVSIG